VEAAHAEVAKRLRKIATNLYRKYMKKKEPKCKNERERTRKQNMRLRYMQRMYCRTQPPRQGEGRED
jgi:hypothetical protein